MKLPIILFGLSLFFIQPFLQPVNALELPEDYVCINVHTANIRSGPGKSYEIVAQTYGLKSDHTVYPLRVIDRNKGWLQVILHKNNKKGWVANSLTKSAAYVTAEKAPILDFPSGKQVDTLNRNTPLCENGHRGIWHRVHHLKKITVYIDSRLTSKFAVSDYGGPFITAILDCDKSKVQKMLDEGETDPVEYPDGYAMYWRGVNHTPLYWALWAGCYDAAEILVKAGAPPNFGGIGDNLIYDAASAANINQIKWLLSKGVDVNSTEHHMNSTPLMAAAGWSTPEVVKLLLENGALVNAQDNYGETALMAAAGYYNEEDNESINKAQAEKVKLLIDAGADKMIRDKKNRTALDYAKEVGNKGILALLQSEIEKN